MGKMERRDIGQTGKTAPILLTMTIAEQAAIDGRRISRYVCDKTGLNAGVVLTDAGFLYKIPVGTRAVITAVLVSLDTLSDTADFQFIATENADGSGAITPITMKLHVGTGAAQATIYPPIYHFATPLVIPYSAVTKALTAKVTTNDAAASVCCSYGGYWEYAT